MSKRIPKDLTPKQREELPLRLQGVWQAVFAQAWHARFERIAEVHGFDHEDDFDHAEQASTKADRAVYQLRAWEAQQ